MRVKIKLFILIVLGTMALPAFGASYRTIKEKPAEYRMYFGADVVVRQIELIAGNGSIKYDFEGIRLRYGLEYTGGASVGIEYMPSDNDVQLGVLGNQLELEHGDTLGLYMTIGKPVHLRIGWSVWEAKFTDLNSGLSDSDTLNAFEVGLGFNTSIGSNFSIFADYSVRKTDAEFPTFVTGTGELDYDTILYSVGLNYLF